MYTNANQQKRPMDFGNGQQAWNPGAGAGEAGQKKRRRRNRWGDDEAVDKTVIPGMPTAVPDGLSSKQERQYVLHLQIEEISRRLRTGDLGIAANPEDRSPSPEPIYNNEGKRLNTREYRTRKKLEEERHRLVQEAQGLSDDYKPPADYKPPVIRVNDKVMIPQEEHPDINFVGLLIGPRGNTLKTLEKETGAKIIIRGKGSVKDGKIGRKDGQPLPGEDEPLHAYVTANNPENVSKAVERIKGIIKESVEVPEGQNDLRKQQLRELALLNGTLRENDGLAKLKQIQQAQTIVTNTIICTNCGGAGHLGKDCKQSRPGDTFRMLQQETPSDKAKMDSEYLSLMAELGEGPPPQQQKPNNLLPQKPHHFSQQNQPHPQSRFNQPPPNPMGNFNSFPPGNRGPPPSLLSLNTTRPPQTMYQQPPQQQQQPPQQQQHPQQPPPLHQPPNMQGMSGGPGLQQPPPLQQQQMAPNQPGLAPGQAGMYQQPQPVAPPPNSQFNPPQFQPGLNQMPPALNVGPVPPPNTGTMPPNTGPVQTPAWSTAAPSQTTPSLAMGVPPPPSSMMGAVPPPPPPVVSQPPNNMQPWMHQGAVPPPPPVSQPGWQHAPPPPPVSMGGMPWQGMGPPPQTAPSGVAPPPPPPSSQGFPPGSSQGFNMPPPPPTGFDPSQMSGVNPLLVAPPPPPPN